MAFPEAIPCLAAALEWFGLATYDAAARDATAAHNAINVLLTAPRCLAETAVAAAKATTTTTCIACIDEAGQCFKLAAQDASTRAKCAIQPAANRACSDADSLQLQHHSRRVSIEAICRASSDGHFCRASSDGPTLSFFQFVRALPALITLLKDSKPKHQ